MHRYKPKNLPSLPLPNWCTLGISRYTVDMAGVLRPQYARKARVGFVRFAQGVGLDD